MVDEINWEVRIWKNDSRCKHFLIEVKYLLSIPVKTMGRQYKVTGVAQADTMRHKSDL